MATYLIILYYFRLYTIFPLFQRKMKIQKYNDVDNEYELKYIKK